MAVALVQSKAYGSTASNSFHFVTFDAAPTTNNLLILAICSDTTINGGSPPTSASTTWSLATSVVDSTGTYLYYTVAPSGSGTEVDVTLLSSDSCSLSIYEYSGLLTASVLDKTATQAGQTAPSIATGTTATTTQADELLFALVGLTGGGGGGAPPTVSSWSNTFAALLSPTSTSSAINIRGGTASRVVSATGAYTTTATTSANVSGGQVGLIATFKASATAAVQILQQPGRYRGIPSLLAQ